MDKQSNIYFVATPIGNMMDITLRALDILSKSDIIYCEDTRNSSNLLKFHNINTKLISYHKFNENERVNEILENLKNNKIISIISDAGMPIINDPGFIILQEVVKNGFTFEILPGACALINGLCGSLFDASSFSYMGFVPKTNSERKKFFEKFKNMHITGVFYESPNRLLKTLYFLKEEFGDINVCVCRELTKIHEEYKRANIEQVIEYYEKKPVKGEIVLVVEKIKEEKKEIDIYKEIKNLKNKEYTNKEIVKVLKEKVDLPKNKIYELVLNFEKEKEL